MTRTGVFGGTFDPPHVGHMIVAQEMAEQLGLDRVLLVPAAEPPHKPGRPRAPGELRARMLEAAAGDHPRLAVSRVELERGGASYTVDTLAALRRASSDDELHLLIGVDQLRTFDSWRSPAEILRLARLVVVAREGIGPQPVEALPGLEFATLAVPRVDVSSTDIRRRCAEGRSIRYLVPDGVRRIIEIEQLYETP